MHVEFVNAGNTYGTYVRITGVYHGEGRQTLFSDLRSLSMVSITTLSPKLSFSHSLFISVDLVVSWGN